MKHAGLSRWVLGIALGTLATIAAAHKVSTAYLTLTADANDAQVFHGQWDIAILDLDFVLGIDSNGDGAVTRGELTEHAEAIAHYAISHIDVRGDGFACPVQAGAQEIDTHTDGAYVTFNFVAACAWGAPQVLQVDYRLFYEVDPSHRGVIVLRAGSEVASGVSAPAEPGIDSGGVRMQLPASNWLDAWASRAVPGFSSFFGGIFAPLSLLLLMLTGIGASARAASSATQRRFALCLGIGILFVVASLGVAATVRVDALLVHIMPVVACALALFAIFIKSKSGLAGLLAAVIGVGIGIGLSPVLAPLVLTGAARWLWLAQFSLGYALAAMIIVVVGYSLRVLILKRLP